MLSWGLRNDVLGTAGIEALQRRQAPRCCTVDTHRAWWLLTGRSLCAAHPQPSPAYDLVALDDMRGLAHGCAARYDTMAQWHWQSTTNRHIPCCMHGAFSMTAKVRVGFSVTWPRGILAVSYNIAPADMARAGMAPALRRHGPHRHGPRRHGPRRHGPR